MSVEVFRYLFTFLMGAAIGALVVFVWDREIPVEPFKIDSESETGKALLAQLEKVRKSMKDNPDFTATAPAPDFAVTGKPRTMRWPERRKELEAAARSKRKKLESFQEYV